MVMGMEKKNCDGFAMVMDFNFKVGDGDGDGAKKL